MMSPSISTTSDLITRSNMKTITINIKTESSVKIGDKSVYEVLRTAADLAHEVLEELSIYRQKKGIDDNFYCEGSACKFLDMIDD